MRKNNRKRDHRQKLLKIRALTVRFCFSFSFHFHLFFAGPPALCEWTHLSPDGLVGAFEGQRQNRKKDGEQERHRETERDRERRCKGVSSTCSESTYFLHLSVSLVYYTEQSERARAIELSTKPKTRWPTRTDSGQGTFFITAKKV